MMCLDCCTWTFEGDTLDDIRIQRSLQELLDLSGFGRVGCLFFNLFRLCFKYVDERVADELPLLLWIISNSFQSFEEQFGSIHNSEVYVQIFSETHNAAVDQNSMKPIAYSFK